MPLQAIPGLQAFENIRTNGQSMWTARGSPEDRVGPLARPMFHPRFSLAKGDKVFTNLMLHLTPAEARQAKIQNFIAIERARTIAA